MSNTQASPVMTKEQAYEQATKESLSQSATETRMDVIYRAMEIYKDAHCAPPPLKEYASEREPAGEGWKKQKPVWQKDCILLTATSHDGWNYTAFQIIWNGDYWMWCTLDGEEYGDIEDLQAEYYKVIYSPDATPPDAVKAIAEAASAAWDACIDRIEEERQYPYGKRGGFIYPNKEQYLKTLK